VAAAAAAIVVLVDVTVTDYGRSGYEGIDSDPSHSRHVETAAPYHTVDKSPATS